ncbi:MAG: ArdC-like ssDNA-binding domain-containing protein [Dehalococcoidales bacterium]|nr:ArdC-like ssDNA-binding domain-containing protein [Dehalococcoidales bacterium]
MKLGKQYSTTEHLASTSTSGERYKFQRLLERSPYEAGEIAGMQMDTIPEALENLQLTFSKMKVKIYPWLTRENEVDAYVVDAKGDFSRALSPQEREEFEKGIRDWLRGAVRSGPSKKIWPQTKKENWVKITKRGASSFSEGSLIKWEEFKEDDRRVRERGEEPASVEIVKEPHPGNGNGGKEVPATIQGEPIPEKYRPLIPLIDEPLPPESDYLVPAIVLEEGERKIDAVLRQLKDGVEGIQNSEQFRLFLETMAKFHQYSLGNQILIALQKPEATRVAGFNTWKNLGRWVKKGATGIAILAPIMPPKPKEEKKEGEEEETPLTPVYFKVVHVFDVSQTEGKPLPEFEVPSLTGEANEELFTKALALAKAQGLEVDFDPMPAQDPSVKGFYSGKKIWVKPDEPRAQQLKTLLHELAHYYSEGVFRIPRRDAETIAESAAFAVGAHFGFDSGVRSFPYVAIWSQDPKVLKDNLGSIRKVTSVMLEGLEKSKVEEGKLLPALRPYDPYEFAEYVLRYNRFSDAEVPIYSGLAGKAPLRVPDNVWREVIEATEGEFIKQGEINIFHIPEKERPTYMYAPPFGGFGKAVLPEWIPPDVQELLTTGIGSLEAKYKLPSSKEANRTQAQSNRLVDLVIKAESGARDVNPQLSDPIWNVYKHLYNLMTDDEAAQYRRLRKEPDTSRLMPQTESNGTCYQDAWRFLLKEKEGHLVHGTVWNGDKRIGHAWVETDTGYIWEPETKKFYTKLGFDNVAAPVAQYRYTVTEASVMAARTKSFGPWSDKEVADYLKKKSPAVILTKPPAPIPKEEMEFISDTPELIPFTIDDIGYRDKLDNAFEMAIAKVQGG